MQFHLLYDSYVSYHSKGPPSTFLISMFQSVADEMPFHQLCDLYEPYHRKGPPLYTKEVQPSNVLHFFQSHVSHLPYVLIAQFDDSYLLNLVDTIVTLAGEYALQRDCASLSAKPVLLASPFARGAHPPRSLVIFRDILQMESLLAGYVDIKVFLKLQLLNMNEEKSTLTRNEYPQRGLLLASRKHKLELSPTLESEVKIFSFVS